MPIETQRKIGFIMSNGIKVPVITSINFRDDPDRAQDYEVTIDNSDKSDRTVSYAWVGSSTDVCQENVSPDSDPPQNDCILVERIKQWKDLDANDRYQEHWPQPDNQTKDENGPPFFTTHQKTHCVYVFSGWPDDDPPVAGDSGWGARQLQRNKTGEFTSNWIEIELIDEISFIEERGLEQVWTLSNPQYDSDYNLLVDSDTPDLTNTQADLPMGNGAPALRLDYFQNPVRINRAYYYPNITIFYSWGGGAGGIIRYDQVHGQGDFTEVIVDYYATCSDGYDIHESFELGDFRGSVTVSPDFFTSPNPDLIVSGIGRSEQVCDVPAVEGMWPPGPNGSEPHCAAEQSGNSFTVTWAHQVLSGLYYVHTPNDVFPPCPFGLCLCTFHGAKNTGAIVDAVRTYSADGAVIIEKNGDALAGKPTDLVYDLVDNVQPTGNPLNPAGFSFTLYTSKYGKAPGA